MYKSPVELIVSEMQTKIEGDIVRAVQSYEIKVDRDELLRALHYDRDQYTQGYNDAKREYEDALLKIIIDKIAKTVYNALS